MAGLTKEQREAKKLIVDGETIEATKLPVEPVEPLIFIRMFRVHPTLPNGPTEADVHPDSVELWLREEWHISE